MAPTVGTLVHAIPPRHDALRDGTVGTLSDFDRFDSRLFVDHLFRLGVYSVSFSSFSSIDDGRRFLLTETCRKNSRNHECVRQSFRFAFLRRMDIDSEPLTSTVAMSNLDEDLMERLRSITTSNREDLIAQFRGTTNAMLTDEGCRFFLEMNNW